MQQSHASERIPTVLELIAQAGDIGYTVDQPDDKHIAVHLNLEVSHRAFGFLVIHALLNYAGLTYFERSLSDEGVSALILGEIPWSDYIDELERKGPRNYQGWIGEMIADFVLHHFINCNQALLGYDWYLMDSPKGDVNDHGLDIVAAYCIQGDKLGHICGEIKTYNDLSKAKSDAYVKLLEAYDRQRDPEIRRTLNALFRLRGNLDPVKAALAAMGDERSFLPSILHDSNTRFVNRQTFSDMADKFKDCQRPSQKIGIQIAITNAQKSDDSFDEFFKAFMRQMRAQADIWVKASREVTSV